MAVRPVRTYPDEVLKRPATPCGAIDDEIHQICQDLADTMLAHERCVGLAAPQIGESKRIIGIDVSGHPKGSLAHHGPLVLIDPVIHAQVGSKVGREGCLSLPQITANVARAIRIVFSGTCPDGTKIESFSADFEARALQHEIDHLDGILILDRVASPSEIFVRENPAGPPGP